MPLPLQLPLIGPGAVGLGFALTRRPAHCFGYHSGCLPGCAFLSPEASGLLLRAPRPLLSGLRPARCCSPAAQGELGSSAHSLLIFASRSLSVVLAPVFSHNGDNTLTFRMPFLKRKSLMDFRSHSRGLRIPVLKLSSPPIGRVLWVATTGRSEVSRHRYLHQLEVVL